jgi:hypothetical protein
MAQKKHTGWERKDKRRPEIRAMRRAAVKKAVEANAAAAKK